MASLRRRAREPASLAARHGSQDARELAAFVSPSGGAARPAERSEAHSQDTDGPEEVALRDDERTRVHAALGRLAPTDREILTLTAWEGLSCAEVSEVLGIPAGRVSVRLHRAKKRFAREYGSRAGATQVWADGGRRHDP